ncbi:hypothetical protein VFPBJ_09214 [Purpureocillium lilacinum]|uniref:Uncharacterized protein n=1 Tax=Purpureocillium lilacinum TaxID=33203 RepID=A0A179GDJ7_PURLI|nr:hypothetical protein VFPBJ_09214 [Purpureocillium lilacinum]
MELVSAKANACHCRPMDRRWQLGCCRNTAHAHVADPGPWLHNSTGALGRRPCQEREPAQDKGLPLAARKLSDESAFTDIFSYAM